MLALKASTTVSAFASGPGRPTGGVGVDIPENDRERLKESTKTSLHGMERGASGYMISALSGRRAGTMNFGSSF